MQSVFVTRFPANPWHSHMFTYIRIRMSFLLPFFAFVHFKLQNSFASVAYTHITYSTTFNHNLINLFILCAKLNNF